MTGAETSFEGEVREEEGQEIFCVGKASLYANRTIRAMDTEDRSA